MPVVFVLVSVSKQFAEAATDAAAQFDCKCTSYTSRSPLGMAASTCGQFSVTGREQSLLPVLRELSSLGKRSPTRASCPCLMKQNSLSHLSGRRFLPSVATCSVLTFPFVAIVRGAITTSFRTSLVSGCRLFSAISQLP